MRHVLNAVLKCDGSSLLHLSAQPIASLMAPVPAAPQHSASCPCALLHTLCACQLIDLGVWDPTQQSSDLGLLSLWGLLVSTEPCCKPAGRASVGQAQMLMSPVCWVKC